MGHVRAGGIRRLLGVFVAVVVVPTLLGPVAPAASVVTPRVADFNGDGRTDVSVFRPSSGGWYLAGQAGTVWGTAGDVPVPGDYDGNGTTDVAVYRPATGAWYIKGQAGAVWGTAGDVPVPGDYDGNGTTDIAVYRPSVGAWYVRGQAGAFWGAPGDIPVPGDYDGNGTWDMAVFRPSVGAWYVRGQAGATWGAFGDVPVIGDYDGNGTTDIAVFRPTTGSWYVLGQAGATWGALGDTPVPGDYDGDGRTDTAVYRRSTGTWLVHGSSGVDTLARWGLGTDVPLPLPGAIATNLPPLEVSADPYTNASSAHRTEVEPDSLSFGTTVVSAFQVGRFFSGGSSNIGWATSNDGGLTWDKGFLPGITTIAGGPYDRATDPAVAYDPSHGAWIVSSLGLVTSPTTRGAAVVVSRSTDGGHTWGAPVVVSASAAADLDKNWTVCDTTATSPFYGRCYTEWDDHGNGNLIFMSTSTDGGLTWSAPVTTADVATGLGGQPLVRPDGTVVVPVDNADESAVRSFVSTNGGATWGPSVAVATIARHTVAGSLRAGPLISAEMDAAGRVYVVWQDCRFESSCSANDIVMSTSADGVTWSTVTRVPIDPVGSGVDHFIPGIGVDRTTAGAGAHLAIAYYFYPVSGCTAATCKLQVGVVSSPDGGARWTPPLQLAGPMSLSWLPDTSQGAMVGDYISPSFANGTAHPVFAVARPPVGAVLDQATFMASVDIVPSAATVPLAADPVLSGGFLPPDGPQATTN